MTPISNTFLHLCEEIGYKTLLKDITKTSSKSEKFNSYLEDGVTKITVIAEMQSNANSQDTGRFQILANIIQERKTK